MYIYFNLNLSGKYKRIHSLLETTVFIIDLQVKEMENKAFSHLAWSVIFTSIITLTTFMSEPCQAFEQRGCTISVMLIIVLKALSTFLFLAVAREYALLPC